MSRTDFDLRRVRGVVFDVDGVLSTVTIPVDADGVPIRTANLRDGFAIHHACRMGYPLAIITGGNSPSVVKRYEALGMTDIYTGASEKLSVFQQWLDKRRLQPHEVAFVGDDLPDLECMKVAGLSVAPADAAHEILKAARYVSPYAGGMGVARDLLEQIMRVQGKWPETSEAFTW